MRYLISLITNQERQSTQTGKRGAEVPFYPIEDMYIPLCIPSNHQLFLTTLPQIKRVSEFLKPLSLLVGVRRLARPLASPDFRPLHSIH